MLTSIAMWFKHSLVSIIELPMSNLTGGLDLSSILPGTSRNPTCTSGERPAFFFFFFAGWFACDFCDTWLRPWSRTKKSWRKERMDWVCVRYTCIPESRENLIRISWESRENLMRPLHSHENLVRKFQPRENLMRISWEFSASINLHIQSFHEKTPKNAHENLVTFSWDSHEKAFQFSREKRLTRISWETHEKSHEKLMKARKSHEKTFQFSRENENLVRFSWDLVKSSWDSHENRWQFSFSHENLMRFSWVLMRIFVRVEAAHDRGVRLQFPVQRRERAGHTATIDYTVRAVDYGIWAGTGQHSQHCAGFIAVSRDSGTAEPRTDRADSGSRHRCDSWAWSFSRWWCTTLITHFTSSSSVDRTYVLIVLKDIERFFQNIIIHIHIQHLSLFMKSVNLFCGFTELLVENFSPVQNSKGGGCHVCVDLTHLAYDVLSCYDLYRRMLAIVLSSWLSLLTVMSDWVVL